MGKFRVTPPIVAGIGAFLCILAAVLLYVLMIKPTQASLATQTARYLAVQTYTKASVDQQQKLLAAANKSLADAIAQWNVYQLNKNPTIDLADRFQAWKQLYHELEFTLGPDIDNFLAKNKSGAIRLGTVHLPAPPNDPNDVKEAIIKIPIVLDPFPAPSTGPGGGGGAASVSGGFKASGGGGAAPGAGTGGISVIGTFDQDLNQVVSWNNFNRIVWVDHVSLSGYSPFIVATYDANIYEFTTNPDLLGAALPTDVGTTPGK